jgi:hypothetical protein
MTNVDSRVIPFIIVPKSNSLQSDGIRHLAAFQKVSISKYTRGYEGLEQRVLNALQRTRHSRYRFIWHIPHTLPPPLSRQ